MMRLLLDTNVVLDHMMAREPFCAKADLLMGLGAVHEVELFMSVSQFTDALYILSSGGRKSQMPAVAAAMRSIRNIMHIAPLGEDEVDAVLSSDWDDLEDACVYFAARSIRADAIITRNQEDFAKSDIPVFDCDGFFEWMRRTHDVEYASIEF